MAQQVLSGAPATVTIQLADQDGNPRLATGPVFVAATRSDGSILFLDEPTTEIEGLIQLELTVAHTAILDLLQLVWVEQGGATVTTTVEIVGGYLFNVVEARDSSSRLREKYSDVDIIAGRRAVTEECQQITGRSFVPRFRRLGLNGRYSPTIRIPDYDIRKLRDVSVDGVVTAGVVMGDSVSLLDQGVFNYGNHNIAVGYEYGLDEPPQRIKDAALLRLQSLIAIKKSGVTDRADYQIVEGRIFAVNRVRGGLTGIKEIDEAYLEWSAPGRSVASVPL